jgi:hypothetical protein
MARSNKAGTIRQRWPLILGGLLASVLLGIACSNSEGISLTARQSDEQDKKAAQRITQEEFRALLSQFQGVYEFKVVVAADEIRDRATDPKVRMKSLRYKLRAIPWMRSALREEDPMLAMLRAWILVEQIDDLLDTKEKARWSAEDLATLKDLSEYNRSLIEEIAQDVLTEEEFALTQADVAERAAASPISELGSKAAMENIQTQFDPSDEFKKILAIPLKPFRAFRGVDRGAAAIENFTVVARHFADTVAGLPELLQWRMQLMVLESWQDENAQIMLASVDRMADSAQRLTATAEKLPDDLRSVMSETLSQVDEQQANLQATLDRADQVVARVDSALDRLQASSEQIDRTAQSTAEAGRAWTGTANAIQDMVAYFQSLKGKPKPGDDRGAGSGSSTGAASGAGSADPTDKPAGKSKGFDINDYESTANALTQAAAELRALTAEIKDMVESGELTEQVTVAGTAADGITDHAAKRGAQLLVLAFALAIVYRVASVLVRRRFAERR